MYTCSKIKVWLWQIYNMRFFASLAKINSEQVPTRDSGLEGLHVLKMKSLVWWASSSICAPNAAPIKDFDLNAAMPPPEY